MNTYKLGNNVKCIVRSFSPCWINDIEMKYGNQPYTVLNDLEAQLTFRAHNKQAKSIQTELSYNIDYADNLRLSNVKLSDRILNLIYSQYDSCLCHVSYNCDAVNGKFYLQMPLNEQMIYQLFIYNADGKLVKAEGSWSTNNNEIIIPEDQKISNSNYLVFYSYPGKGYNLQKTHNFYFTLDLEISGNKDESTSSYWIHLEKCALEIDKNLYFSGNVNTVDLNFKILHSDEDYITIK